MRRVRSIHLKFLTKSHESERRREKQKERDQIRESGRGKSTSSHQDVEDNADETSSRLARVIDDEEDEGKKKERKGEETERGDESLIV